MEGAHTPALADTALVGLSPALVVPQPYRKTALLLVLLGGLPGAACDSALRIERGGFACGAGGPCPAGVDAAAAPDAGPNDLDAEARDVAAADAREGAPDAGFFDAMNLDAMSPDAGVVDAGSADAGGLRDVGFMDAMSAGRDAEPTGNLGGACALPSDCTSGVCFDLGSGGAQDLRCVRSCGRGEDCPNGFGCYNQSGVRLCLSASYLGGGAYAGSPGAACASNADCRSTFCDANHCLEVCFDDSDCGAGRCRLRRVTPTSRFGTCDGPAGTAPKGATCMVGSDCASGVCLSSLRTCAQLCRNSLSCAAGEFCVSADASDCVVPGNPNCQEAAINIVHYCSTRAVGTTPTGGSCAMNEDCRSFYCRNQRCADTCSTSRDCPAPLVCRPLVSGQALGLFDYYTGYCLP